MLLFFRFLAALFLLIAVIAAVYDGTRSMAADRLVTASLLEHWSTIAPTLLNTAQAAVKRMHPCCGTWASASCCSCRPRSSSSCSVFCLPMRAAAGAASTCSPTEPYLALPEPSMPAM